MTGAEMNAPRVRTILGAVHFRNTRNEGGLQAWVGVLGTELSKRAGGDIKGLEMIRPAGLVRPKGVVEGCIVIAEETLGILEHRPCRSSRHVVLEALSDAREIAGDLYIVDLERLRRSDAR